MRPKTWPPMIKAIYEEWGPIKDFPRRVHPSRKFLNTVIEWAKSLCRKGNNNQLGEHCRPIEPLCRWRIVPVSRRIVSFLEPASLRKPTIRFWWSRTYLALKSGTLLRALIQSHQLTICRFKRDKCSAKTRPFQMTRQFSTLWFPGRSWGSDFQRNMYNRT